MGATTRPVPATGTAFRGAAVIEALAHIGRESYENSASRQADFARTREAGCLGRGDFVNDSE